MSVFTGIWVPLVTPFADGAIDHRALRKLVELYGAAGVSGLVALGTTGEAAALERSEQAAVLDTVLDAANGVPVIVGLAGNNAAHLRDAVARVSALPVAGILTPAPLYVRPSQDGLRRHFLDLADASAKPLVIYDIPYRTGVQIDADTLLSLAAHPRIQAVKDCGGSLEKTLALILDGRLQVLAGDDLNIFSTLCLGGRGAIVASAHIRPELFVAMHRAAAAGELDEARAIFHTLVPAIRALFSEPNPGPVKAALSAMGLICDELRPPMTRATGKFRERWAQLTATQVPRGRVRRC
jgi:4-hydroxy-tetrahydrodipicolinate synthase